MSFIIMGSDKRWSAGAQLKALKLHNTKDQQQKAATRKKKAGMLSGLLRGLHRAFGR